MNDDGLNGKLERLKALLLDMGSVLAAFSGGVDSAFLIKVSAGVLGENVLAVTARSATTPSRELRDAVRLAGEWGVRHCVLETDELELDAFTQNGPDRCYVCKKHRFADLVRMASREGWAAVIDGENIDDGRDYRPGSMASRELGIRSPLREAGLGKEEIRELSRRWALPTWDRPSAACLASRIPYGDRITAQKLKQVDAAENFLRDLDGMGQIRVRHHGDTARIEADAEGMARFGEPALRGQVAARLKELGFCFVALDLEGYETGSLNRLVSREKA